MHVLILALVNGGYKGKSEMTANIIRSICTNTHHTSGIDHRVWILVYV